MIWKRKKSELDCGFEADLSRKNLLDYSPRSQVEVFIYNIVDLLGAEFLAVTTVGEHADRERFGNADCIGNLQKKVRGWLEVLNE